MAIKLVKLKDLEYNEILTIALIFNNLQLKELFASDLKLPLELLITCSKENRLSVETKTVIRSVFDDVILFKADLISHYEALAHKEGVTLTDIKQVIPKEIIKIAEPVLVEVTPQKVVQIKKEKIIPRRYGKEKILKDIAAQGGKATPLQNAMLRVNDLKNIYVNLNARGIKDMVGGTKLLTDSDCRDITSAIKIVEMRLNEILKRKNEKTN